MYEYPYEPYDYVTQHQLARHPLETTYDSVVNVPHLSRHIGTVVTYPVKPSTSQLTLPRGYDLDI
jgi:hypothetical protein